MPMLHKHRKRTATAMRIFNHEIPEWNAEGTVTNEEIVLLLRHQRSEPNYGTLCRYQYEATLRLKRAWVRLDMIYEETEGL